MQPLTPSFKIWVATDATGSEWALVYTTPDLGEAAAFFQRQAGEGAHVAVYERGRFYDGSKYATGFVGFIWSANLNGYMEGEPIGRGHGWTEADTLVQYEYPYAGELQQDERPGSAEVTYPTPSAPSIYEAQEQCHGCSRLAPVRSLRWLTHDVETGHSSGTHRQSRSYSTTISGRGVSNTSRRSSGSTSGRRYYRREELLLCEQCYDRQVSADRGQMVKGFFRNLLGI